MKNEKRGSQEGESKLSEKREKEEIMVYSKKKKKKKKMPQIKSALKRRMK